MCNPRSLLVCSCGGQNKVALMAFSSACCFFLSPLKMFCPKWEVTSDSQVFRTFPKCLLLNLIPGLGCWFLPLLLCVHYRSCPDFKSMRSATPLHLYPAAFFPSPRVLKNQFSCSGYLTQPSHHILEIFTTKHELFNCDKWQERLTGLVGIAEPGRTTLLVLRLYSSLAD